MTSPIDRAAEALIPYSGAMTNRTLQAQKVFESVDPDGLAQVIVRDLTYSTGLDAESNDSIARHQATAVIAHLTGKDQT